MVWSQKACGVLLVPSLIVFKSQTTSFLHMYHVLHIRVDRNATFVPSGLPPPETSSFISSRCCAVTAVLQSTKCHGSHFISFRLMRLLNHTQADVQFRKPFHHSHLAGSKTRTPLGRELLVDARQVQKTFKKHHSFKHL